MRGQLCVCVCVYVCVCVRACVHARTHLTVPTVTQAVGLIPRGRKGVSEEQALIMIASWFEFPPSIGAPACLHEGWTAGACVLTGGWSWIMA